MWNIGNLFLVAIAVLDATPVFGAVARDVSPNPSRAHAQERKSLMRGRALDDYVIDFQCDEHVQVPEQEEFPDNYSREDYEELADLCHQYHVGCTCNEDEETGLETELDCDVEPDFPHPSLNQAFQNLCERSCRCQAVLYVSDPEESSEEDEEGEQAAQPGFQFSG